MTFVLGQVLVHCALPVARVARCFHRGLTEAALATA